MCFAAWQAGTYRLDAIHQRLHNRRLELLRHRADRQRHHAGALRADAVELRRGVEEVFVVGFRPGFIHRAVLGRVRALACRRKRLPCSQLFVCVSRACVGNLTVF